MVQHYPTSPLDREPDGRMSFTDITILTLLTVSAAALAVVFLLGAVSAEHRIVGVLGLV